MYDYFHLHKTPENGSKTHMSDSMRLRKNRRERLQRRNGEVWGDGDEGYVHYLTVVMVPWSLHLHQNLSNYAFQMCTVQYMSILP